MKAVETDGTYDLVSPKNGAVIKTIKARSLWIRILSNRIETGEPYILFSDRLKEATPIHHRYFNLHPETSNLCSEITLPTGLDHHGVERTAVCCLSSLNLEKWDEWKNDTRFIYDIMEFLDNILEEYIETAPDSMKSAVYSATRERSVGLGVMGLHSYFQSHMIPWESPMAKSINMQMFKHIDEKAKEASNALGILRGPCVDAKEYSRETGIMNWNRFSYKTAIAPTASISILCGQSSPGVEPFSANAYQQKVLGGNYHVKNKYLKALLASKNKDNEEVWLSIVQNRGSVAHLDFLADWEKSVFKTAIELDPRWIIELAADRTPHVDQSQSINLFLPADIHKADLHAIHYLAWKKGLKSLYYCRSTTLKNVDSIPNSLDKAQIDENGLLVKTNTATSIQPRIKDIDECLACQ
jgi:ribonucleoside-diphosphate reductase alpha chain